MRQADDRVVQMLIESDAVVDAVVSRLATTQGDGGATVDAGRKRPRQLIVEAYCRGVGARIWLVDALEPVLQLEDEVLVQILRVDVRGTDRHVIGGDASRALPNGNDDLILGTRHETGTSCGPGGPRATEEG